MDELVAARAELDRLQQEELQLLKQLLDVRAAADAQKIKIDALIRERNETSRTSRLPVELLVKIFGLCICPDSSLAESIYWRRQQIASVSRHWRDVVLHTSTLWQCIIVSSSIPFLKTQLERSGREFLDINIDPRSEATLIENLRIISPCATRWRSLIMDVYSASFMALVIDEINHLELPFFQGVRMNVAHSGLEPLPAFLSSKFSLTLEHLTLGHLDLPPDFPTLSKLKTLELAGVGLRSLSPTIFFSQSLNKLSLFKTTVGRLPDSIELPVLRTLILHIDDPKQLLEAILAPMLQCFNYSCHVHNPDSVVFSRVKNKFHAVHHLAFSIGDTLYRPGGTLHHPGGTYGVTLCQAFPSVRYLKIHANDMDRIFEDRQQSGSPRCFMDDCNSLEEVIICYFGVPWALKGTDTFVQWLTNRIGLGQRRLRVKLIGMFPSVTTAGFIAICDRLRKCCILELDVLISPPVPPLRVVSAPSSQISIARY